MDGQRDNKKEKLKDLVDEVSGFLFERRMFIDESDPVRKSTNYKPMILFSAIAATIEYASQGSFSPFYSLATGMLAGIYVDRLKIIADNFVNNS